MIEPADCRICNPSLAAQRIHTVATWCPEHGLPEEVGLTCRCPSCCCEPGKGHKHPQYIWWEAYQDAVESGQREHQARWSADVATGRACDPMSNRHSTPHVGCIMR